MPIGPGADLARLAAKQAAGLSADEEISLLSALPPKLAAAELLKAWEHPLSTAESLAFLRTPVRLSPIRAWSGRFRPCSTRGRLRFGITPPKPCGGSTATRPPVALWPHLEEEADLGRKLQLIAFLGRHGFRDGYSQAIEHLSQVNLRHQAVEALGAVGDPRAAGELRRIWQTSNDLAWNAAAIRRWRGWGRRTSPPSCSSWRVGLGIRWPRRPWSDLVTWGARGAADHSGSDRLAQRGSRDRGGAGSGQAACAEGG